MELKQDHTNSFKTFLKHNRSRLKRSLALFLLLIFFFSLWLASGFVKKKGYNGILDFLSTTISNYKRGLDAHPEQISIEISDKDFKKLEKNRKQALERGVIINDIDGDYVPAVINYNGKKINVKLRLKGHMTDHLQDNKWSFRIKVKEKDESIMGMKRFSIQHPGTRGYIYEWIYHELMKREDVIALRYKFINVSVNGRDWGIYALEENFENELIENNSRLKAPILRFNPDLYWVRRYEGLTKTVSTDEFASYYSANPEAYREDKILSDSIQKQYYLKAIALMEGLRNKRINVEDAFDIPRLAKFHAVIDLVGGIHSIDWSDIKYYYNPVTARLEPVAYESFTFLQANNLSSEYRFVTIDSVSNYEDWHSMIFSNKYFFKEYVKNLERICRPEYLDSFFVTSNNELNANLAIINKEFPYKKFDKTEYYNHQKVIRKILNPAGSIHAYFKSANDKNIIVQIGCIDALPVQIHSVNINGHFYKPVKEIILPSKQHNDFIHYSDYSFESGPEFIAKNTHLDSVKINYSLLGSSDLKQSKVFSFPHTDANFIITDIKNKKDCMDSISFLSVDRKNNVVQIKSGNHIINKDIIIPEGYKLVVNSGVTLDFKNKSKLLSYSPVFFNGSEDQAVIIQSSDSTGQGIILIQTKDISKLNYVTFRNLPEIKDSQWKRKGGVTIYESEVEFNNCSFYNCKSENAVRIIRSAYKLNKCLFQNIGNDAFDADFSDGTISDCVFESCRENAIDITMGKLNIHSVYISSAGNKAINMKAGSQLKGSDIRIKNSLVGISAEDLSDIVLDKASITDSWVGVTAYKNKPAAGQPQIKIDNLILTSVKRKFLKEKKSVIIINGADEGEILDNVETAIKNEKSRKK
jgi:hypothetical protein